MVYQGYDTSRTRVYLLIWLVVVAEQLVRLLAIEQATQLLLKSYLTQFLLFVYRPDRVMSAEGASQTIGMCEPANDSYNMSSQAEAAITVMQQKLPPYIQNIFVACGYYTLQIIAKMNVNESSKRNDIDKMLEYVKNTFPNDNRYAL